MREQIRRILEMVGKDRLSSEDAAQLLAALSGKLNFPEGTWPHVFALLAEGAFSPEEVAALLEVKAGLRRGPEGLEGLMEDVPRRLREALAAREAVGAAFAKAGRGAKVGTTLRVEIEDSSGSELRANLPLSLAEHTAKLLPPRVLGVLEQQGVSAEALTMLLTAGPPPGELLAIEANDGTEIRLTVE